jgi:hypothetical protein
MPETSQSQTDSAGVTRTPTGEIADQSHTSTPETIVRPPPTPTKQEALEGKITESKDGKEAKAPDKSLLNEKSPETGAPEKYEDFTVPEGFELDKDVATEFGTIAKKHNLTQSGAQELVDFYVNKTKEAFEAPFNAYMDKRQEWRDQINSDSEIGGSKLNGVKVSIGKLIDSFGDAKVAEAFREAMDYTGAGDNPAVVKGLYALAKRLTEGAAVRGNGPSPEGMREPGLPARPGPAAAIYPHLPSSSDRR